MELSIVTTLYCSAPYVEEFYTRISAAAQRITSDYEIVFVDDGSPDNSLEIALSIVAADRHVRVIELSRNFGHYRAIMTGLAHARGELVFLIDSDLEEEPELLDRFYSTFHTSGADVVYGVQRNRRGGLYERLSGKLFYEIFSQLFNYPVPHNVVTARLMKRQYVISLVEHKDREIFLAGLWAITGFRQLAVMIEKKCKGQSTYNLGRKISGLVNSITSFSNRPLVYIFYLGAGVVFISGLAALYLMVRRILFGVFLAGWASLIVSVWLLGGLSIFCLGIIGIYLSKVFSETKQRPYTIIRRVYGCAEEKQHETQPGIAES